MADVVRESARDLPPTYLYKYRPFDEPDGRRLRQIIVDNELWAGSPSAFNDPYDCFPIIDPAGTRVEKKYYAEKYVERRVRDLRRSPKRFLRRQIRKTLLAVINEQDVLGQQTAAWRDTIGGMGLVSLSEDPTSMPLWAHYGADHTGICLEFSTAQAPFSSAQRVVYSDERPVFRFLERNRNSLIHRVLLRKAEDWKYEREWRFFAAGYIGAIRLSSSSLRSIILGARISADHEAAIRTFAERRIGKVRFKRAVIDNRLYRMAIVDE